MLNGVFVNGDPNEGNKHQNVEKVQSTTEIEVDYIGVFKGYQLKGWLNEDESKGFNYITDNIDSTVVLIDCEDGKISLETMKSTTKVTGQVKKGKPEIQINVSTEGNVGELECKIAVSNPENIKQLEIKYEESQKKMIEDALERAQTDFQSDIFGFGEAIHRANPRAWKQLKKNWDEEFANLEVNVKVDAKIKNLGSITDSF